MYYWKHSRFPSTYAYDLYLTICRGNISLFLDIMESARLMVHGVLHRLLSQTFNSNCFCSRFWIQANNLNQNGKLNYTTFFPASKMSRKLMSTSCASNHQLTATWLDIDWHFHSKWEKEGYNKLFLFYSHQ